MDGTKSAMGEPLEIGAWKQISVLGSGGFGIVTLWRHKITNENVAIKKCKFQRSSRLSPRQKERWNQEVEFLKSCNHDNLVKFKILPADFESILQKHNPTKLPLMTMEYCTKGNLRRYLLTEPIKMCGLEESDVRYVLQDVSNGLSYLHSKNITHRDLKPENIVLQNCNYRRGHHIYKIIDLGYAKELQYTIQSQVGTLHYLSPEIFENRRYDHSVDYWSMGLVVFEVICGVLPFLPEMTPFERFEKIRGKGPDDICIYMQSSGAIATSAEIKREHFISSCLKLNLETWLKCVLQYDSTKRRFSNSLGVFEYLQYILDKKIIKVFWLYKLKLYSYEIKESTRIKTLEDWISRDLKIPKDEFMILFNNTEHLIFKDGEQLIYEFINDETIVYVINKRALLSNNMEFNPSKAIKDLLFSSGEAFPPKFARNLYRQCLYFVYSEKLSVSMLRESFGLLLKYIKIIFDKLEKYKFFACEAIGSLLKKVNDYIQQRKSNCDIDISESIEAKDCLKNLKRLLASCDRSVGRIKDYIIQFEALNKLKEEILDGKYQDGLDACSIDEQFSKINTLNFLETRNGEPDIVKRFSQVISQTIKLKTNHVYKNNNIKDWFKDFCTVVDLAEQLISWASDFVTHVKELSTTFTEVEEKYQIIIQEESHKRMSENQIDPTQLLKENEDLRYQFDEVLSKSLLVQKNNAHDFESLF